MTFATRDSTIEEGGTGSAEPVAAKSLKGSSLAWGAFGVAALLALTLSVPAMTHFREARPAEVRLEINTPFTPAPLHFALSPDGRYIVFVASVDGPRRLWLRALDKTDARPLAGTDGAEYPFWSKDSRSIGFFASGKLLRIDLGGPAQVITDAPYWPRRDLERRWHDRVFSDGIGEPSAQGRCLGR